MKKNKMVLKTLTWHPAKSNPLDFVDRKGLLFDKSKEEILITLNRFNEFCVNGEIIGSNIDTCAKLYELEAGFLCSIYG